MIEQALNRCYSFLALQKIDDLAVLLETSQMWLKTIALNPEYRIFKVSKRSGGMRMIEAPSPALKKIQKKLNHHLQQVYLALKPDAVHGYVINPGKCGVAPGIVSNAGAHVSRSHIINLDIEDFFHSFRAIDVWKLFRGDPFNFSDALANILAMLTTWYDILPVGSPASPVLTNFLMYNHDLKLSEIAAKHNGIYSRYADDLTFSFNYWIPDGIIREIKSAIGSFGFRLNESKFRIESKKVQQSVTGLVVNQKVNVDRRYIRRIRAVLFDWKTNGLDKAARRYYNLDFYPDRLIKTRFQESVKGRILFIGHIRGKTDAIYSRLNNQFEALNL